MDIAKMNRQRAAQAFHLAETTLSTSRRALYLSLASEWTETAAKREAAIARAVPEAVG